MFSNTCFCILVGCLASSRLVNAHTWIEQLMVISDNGTMVGQPGFPRGNVLRSNPSFNDPAMVNLLPPGGRTINDIRANDLMCKSSQTSQTQTDGSPRLQVAAGSAVALRYQENGHVSLPANQPGKPPNRGTVFVYGTTEPSPDDAFLAIHRVWNAAGTGGDGRGVLLSTQNFDDGQCYQVNGGAISAARQNTFKHDASSLMGGDLWCQQDIAIPADAPSGKPYTLYWVWDWPTMPGTAGFPNGKQEIYTTCMDVDIVNSGSTVPASKAASVQFVQNQDLNSAGIASELADITNPTAIVAESIPFGASATGPAAGAAAAQSAEATAGPALESTIPAFLSVHTTSTGGPGLETNTFSVIPIGQASPTTIPEPTGPGGGRGHRGSGGDQPAQVTAAGETTSITTSVLPLTTSFTAGSNMATVTEYDSITETFMETVFRTRFTKRTGTLPTGSLTTTGDLPQVIPVTTGSTVLTFIPVETPAPSPCSKTEAAYRLRARIPFFDFAKRAEPTGC